ncbi:potassium channel family protein [Chamaesiphon minutus]|uniref:K+ transport system, NAD-binding component n=1 Tax=Chamaesiphon minutus (strain ATCC 27169 / PCC 6605) TaxID=1173020 RepID=K9UMH9_CHAP6|nr:potassium channel protein [Chamaesiphon minutus]AFY95656.1 K+ transport system, NAD-binding component [Chamaesiphon minutus PCC 6605]
MDSAEQKYRRIRTELQIGVFALALVFIAGTLWYSLIEGWHWLDAVYMTTITLTTVGYGETNPLGSRGRIFTIVLILAGVLTIGYIVNRFTEAIVEGYFIEGRILKQQRKFVDSLVEHFIICGFGRIGRQIATEFAAEGTKFVIVDANSEQVRIAQSEGYNAIQADATLDETLLKMRVRQATCLVAALPSDAENLYIILSAKTLNPNIRAIARASNEEAVLKLQRAGADKVISPYITGARRMAAAALRPQVMDFMDGIVDSDRSFYMEEFLIDAQTCPVAGLSLREARLRSQSGSLVLAVRRQNGTLIVGPTGETIIMGDDMLICMGTADQLRVLNQILDPLTSASDRGSLNNN